MQLKEWTGKEGETVVGKKMGLEVGWTLQAETKIDSILHHNSIYAKVSWSDTYYTNKGNI